MSTTENLNQEAPSPFSQLVIMIATSALQQLGQIPDPAGQRGEVQLEGAQHMIDMLEMLSAKTKGNLEENEAKMLTDSLTMLRFQYVEAAQAKGTSPDAKKTPAADTSGTATPPTNPPPPVGDDASAPLETPAADRPSGESKTRYRKSYG